MAAPGRTLCLLDGNYIGANSIIAPPSGLTGADGAPITIRALNDGAVTIDGEFQIGRIPISFNNNRFWIVQGINAKNGDLGVIQLYDSDNITLRRIAAWDVNFSTNNSIFLNWQRGTKTGENLVEDSAFFGTSAITVGNYTDVGSPTGSLRMRRVWCRNEGSASQNTGTECFQTNYRAKNFTCEDCIGTWSETSYPTTFQVTNSRVATIAAGTGGCIGPVGSRCHGAATVSNPYCVSAVTVGIVTDPPCYAAVFRSRAGGGTGDTADYNSKFFGVLVYLLPGVTYGNDRLVYFQDSAANRHVRHLYSWMPAQVLRKSGANNTANIYGVTVSGVVTDSGMEFVTSVSGKTAATSFWGTGWTVTPYNEASTIAGLPSGVQSPWTTTTGANLCTRTNADGTKSSTPLWPWPMNDRIKAATAAAGSYTGPCLNCTGGRAARQATDVTADIESILGTIPAQCRN